MIVAWIAIRTSVASRTASNLACHPKIDMERYNRALESKILEESTSSSNPILRHQMPALPHLESGRALQYSFGIYTSFLGRG